MSQWYPIRNDANSLTSSQDRKCSSTFSIIKCTDSDWNGSKNPQLRKTHFSVSVLAPQRDLLNSRKCQYGGVAQELSCFRIYKISKHKRHEIFTAVSMKITVFWDVTPCSSVDIYQILIVYITKTCSHRDPLVYFFFPFFVWSMKGSYYVHLDQLFL
jgi:hypothetical protein